MKKTLVFAQLFIAAAILAGCGNKTAKVPFDNGDSLRIANVDPTVYGVCGEGTAMNTLEIITDTGDTLNLDIDKARLAGKVFGGLQVGDRMAVIPDSAKTAALMVVNQVALLGNWVMPNPIDGSDEIGISIKEGGVAESIDNPNLSYRTWRLNRGQLEIVFVREGGSEEEETGLYDIVKLGNDSLVFKDEDDTFEYGRQKPHEQYGKDVKLEESSFDEDFKM